ncbi:hypothetical protein [Phenylobacterium aquaticum]|nr:hypothetical protein [Phenylobacterium aquaticum]
MEDTASLVRQALVTLVQDESARRLARLGGGDPEVEASPHGDPH